MSRNRGKCVARLYFTRASRARLACSNNFGIGLNPNAPGTGDGTSITPPASGGGGVGFSLGAGDRTFGSLAASGATFFFNYQRNKLALADITFQVEWSDTLALGDWHTNDVTEEIVSDNDSIQQVRATVPVGTAGQRFVRLKMIRP